MISKFCSRYEPVGPAATFILNSVPTAPYLMYRYVLVTTLAALAATLVAPYAVAQDFEGILKHREIELGREAIVELLEGRQPDVAKTARHLAERSAEQLLQAEGARTSSHISYLKGDLISVHPQSSARYTIVDARSATIRDVNPEQKSYSDGRLETMKGGTADKAGSIEHMGIDKLELDEWEDDPRRRRFISRRTGAETKLNGFQVSVYEYVGPHRVVIGWCALDTTGYVQSRSSRAVRLWLAGETTDDATDAVCPADLLPVRTLAYRDDPPGLWIREIQLLRREAVAEERFSVPPDYVGAPAAKAGRYAP